MDMSFWDLGAKDILQLLTSIVALWIAGSGLSTWRKQLNGNIEHELSRRIYLHAIKYREAFRWLRFSGISFRRSGEGYENFDQDQYNGYREVFGKRIDRIATARQDLLGDLFEAEVIWEKHQVLKGLVQELYELDVKAVQAIYDHIEYLNPNTSDEVRQYLKDKSRATYKLMYDSGSENGDEYRQKFNAIVDRIGDFLRQNTAYRYLDKSRLSWLGAHFCRFKKKAKSAVLDKRK